MKKIRDMKVHVSKVCDMGMKYLLWYSVPYVDPFGNVGKIPRQSDYGG